MPIMSAPKFLLSIALAFVSLSAAAAGNDGAKLDPAMVAERLKKRSDWYAQHWTGAYDRLAQKDPQWDGLARDVIAAVHRELHGDDSPATGDERDTVWHSGNIAYARGCRDPFLMYLRARSYMTDKDLTRVVQFHLEAADAMRKSGYHDILKVYAEIRAAALASRAGDADKAKRLTDEAVARLPATFADKDLPTDLAAELIDVLSQSSATLFKDPSVLTQKALDAAAAAKVAPSVLLTLQGQHHIKIGWSARGTGFANTVTPEGAKTLDEQTRLARVALTKAWELDPYNFTAATLMLSSVELTDPTGPDGMELWYARANAARPHNRAAVFAKINWLEPKWHGSPEAMLAFGRELRDGKNWDELEPLYLAEVHMHLANYAPDRATYFRSVAGAWDDVHDVMEDYLARVKKPSPFHMARYAAIAAWTGHWAESAKAFKYMPDKYAMPPTSYADFEGLRKQAADHAGNGGDKAGTSPLPF